jgi:hypothetical protein
MPVLPTRPSGFRVTRIFLQIPIPRKIKKLLFESSVLTEEEKKITKKNILRYSLHRLL